MPRLDGTGPAGMGPMTGGARGWCNPYGSPYAGARGAPFGSYGAPYANRPYAFRPYRGYPPAYGFGRPRWGLGRGFWGLGRGRGGWGRGRGRTWR